MKTTMFDQIKVALQMVFVTLAYALLGMALLGSAEGAWRFPAALVMAFFLPALLSSAMQFYWQLCRPALRRITKAA